MKSNSPRQRAIRRNLQTLIPAAPYADFAAIFDAAKARHMRELAPADAAFLTRIAHIRHRHTEYDELRDDGYDAESARHFVLNDINAILTEWGSTRFVNADGA